MVGGTSDSESPPSPVSVGSAAPVAAWPAFGFTGSCPWAPPAAPLVPQPLLASGQRRWASRPALLEPVRYGHPRGSLPLLAADLLQRHSTLASLRRQPRPLRAPPLLHSGEDSNRALSEMMLCRTFR